MSLSSGTLRAISNGDHPARMMLQIVKMKPMPNGQRMSLTVSDGVNFMQAIITTQLNDVVSKLKVTTLIEVVEYIVSKIQQRNVLIIIGVGNVMPAPGDAIVGSPTNVVSGEPLAGAAGAGAGAATKPQGGYSSGYSAPSAGYSSRGPVAASAPVTNYQPVDALNPYSSNFTIKVRVTAKSDVRTWSNARSSGKVFSVDLIDENGTEIQGTFFNDEATKFFDMIQPQQVYFISGGRISLAKKRFTSITNDHAITFNRTTQISLAPQDSRIKMVSYKFVPINRIAELEKGARVDVIGYVRNPQEIREITTRSGSNTTKRDMDVVDDSGSSIRLTLWGDKTNLPAEAMSGDALIAIKGGVVGEYNGKTLGTWRTTKVDFNPDIPEATHLRTWLAANPDGLTSAASLTSGGGGGPSSNASSRKSIAAIGEEGLGHGEKPDYVTVKASVAYIKPSKKSWYPACPRMRDGRQCNKRVDEAGPGRWRCEKCQVEMDAPEYRYILSVSVADHSGSTWTTMFNETAESTVGSKAGDLQALFNEKPEDEATAELDQKFKEAAYKTYIMRFKVSLDSYNDQQRLRVQCAAARPLDFATESRVLLSAIKAFDA